MSSDLRTTVPENRAKLVKADGDTAVTHTTTDYGATTFEREWTELDATVAESLKETMLLTSQITDPLADGETWGGVYSNANVTVVEDGRRWVTIRQKLIRLTVVLSSTDLPQPVASAKREIYRPFQYDPGDGDIRIFEYKYLSRSSREVCMDPTNITDVQLAQSGYTVEGRRWATEPRGDRTCTFVTLQRKVTWSNIDTSDRKDVDTIRTIGEEGYYAGINYLKHLSKQNETAFGVPIDDAANITSQWHSDEDPATSGYATENVSIQVRGDGEVYISRTREPVNVVDPVDITATASGILLERQMFPVGSVPRRCVVLIPNLIKSTADTLLTALRSASLIELDSTSYRNSGVKRRIHSSGLCDLIVTGTIPTAGSVRNQYQDGSIANFSQQIVTMDDGTRYRVIGQRLVVRDEASAVKFMNAEDPYDGVVFASLVRPPKGLLAQHLDGKMDYADKMDRYICIRFVWQSVEDTVGTFAVAPAVEDPSTP